MTDAKRNKSTEMTLTRTMVVALTEVQTSKIPSNSEREKVLSCNPGVSECMRDSKYTTPKKKKPFMNNGYRTDACAHQS